MRIAVWLTHPEVACWNFAGHHVARLEREADDLAVTVCHDEGSFLRALANAEVAVVWHFEQAWFAGAPRLRWIATPAAGRDFFRITAPANVRVTYGAFHGKLIGETAVGMLLGAARGLITAGQRQGSDPWPRAALSEVMRPLRGSHLVVLGFGHIGQWIASLAKPFGVRITGVKRRPIALPDCFAAGDRVVTLGELDAALGDADHLLLALPSGPETHHLIDRPRLSLLPPQAWVYNVGRGNALDGTALAEALHAGRVAGACLDVFEEEPLPAGHPLRSAPNVLIMPHASAIAPNYLDLYLNELIPEFTEGLAREGSQIPTRP